MIPELFNQTMSTENEAVVILVSHQADRGGKIWRTLNFRQIDSKEI